MVRGVSSQGETRKLREVVAKHAPDAYTPNLEYPQPGKYTISGHQLALHPALAAIAENPAIVDRVEALLEQVAHLSAFVAYIRTPGNKGGGAHNDYKRWRPVGSSMNWLFAIVPLTDFDAEYGPLLVSPGSHKLHRVVDPAARILDVTRPDGGVINVRTETDEVLLMSGRALAVLTDNQFQATRHGFKNENGISKDRYSCIYFTFLHTQRFVQFKLGFFLLQLSIKLLKFPL